MYYFKYYNLIIFSLFNYADIKLDSTGFNSPEKTFSNRVSSLDLARFFAMLFMIQGHTIYAITDPLTIDYSIFPWNFWNFFRGLTAPVFLMVSGAVHIFANKRDENGDLPHKTMIKRFKMCLLLLIIGYILAYPPIKIYQLNTVPLPFWADFFKVNILHIFAISLFLLTLIYKVTKTDKQLAIVSLSIAVGITALSPMVLAINWNDYLHLSIANYLTYQNGSIFSIFPYTAYLFYGVVLGLVLKNMDWSLRNNFLMKYGMIAGLLVSVLMYPMYLNMMPIYSGFMFKASPAFTLLTVGLVLLFISFSAFIYKYFANFDSIFSLFSKRSIVIYVVHLAILYGTPVVPSFQYMFGNRLDMIGSLFAVGIVILMTLIITYIFDVSLKKQYVPKVYRYSFTAYLIYLLFI